MRHYSKSSLAVSLLAGACWFAPASSEAAVAENVIYDLASIRFVIPRIETTGGSLSDADLKAILDPNSADTLAQRIGKLSASSISVPQVVFEMKIGPAGNRVTYRDIKLNNVANGMIEAATVAAASGDMKDPAGGEVKIVYGAMSARKINLALMLRMFAARRTDANEPMATIYEDFTADGMQMTSGDADVSVGRITGSGVKGRALATPIGELVALSQQFATPGAKPTPQQAQQLMAIAADFMQNIEIGRVESRDMKVRAKKEGAEVAIGRIFMSGLANAKVGEIAYENFVIAMPDGNAKLGRVALRDFDLKRTFAGLAAAAASGDMEFRNTNPRTLIPTLGQFQISGLELDVPDKNGQGNSEDGKRILFKLGNFEINTSNPIDGIPTAIRTSVQNFFFPVPKNPADARLKDIAELGVDRIDLSHNLEIAWSEASKEIAIKDYSFSLAGLGAMKLSGVVGNVPKELFSSNMALVQAAAFGALVKSADLSVDNKGMVEKGLALQAKKSGQTPEQIQQMLVAGAAMGIPALLGNGAASKAIGNALAKFAAEPKTLHIVARAKDGLGASDMMLLSNPAALLEKIDVTASANE